MKIVMPVFVEAGVFVAALVSLFRLWETGLCSMPLVSFVFCLCVVSLSVFAVGGTMVSFLVGGMRIGRTFLRIG